MFNPVLRQASKVKPNLSQDFNVKILDKSLNVHLRTKYLDNAFMWVPDYAKRDVV